ncbi:trehalose operon repressor [Lactobacillus sp. ESL0684]|uniref:trehalose operon repressor n=1 Tax=Lactobacillus sp. ESL0684 TaxID=2983213 RepID=UPI0023F9160B|nr:trehalose operon repressor [Lactobacillus sp. ESL0684]WEV43696.1 trehalose operon repressor [Lactobacillus sp. ESL0684]
MAQGKADLIAQDIAAKIRHKQFVVGSFLPSESQLKQLYGTSRETVRKALAQLEALGLIQKIRGKGSLVLNLDKYSFPISGITSFAELNKSLGMHAQTKVLALEKLITIPKIFKEKFPKQPETKGIYVERLRLLKQQPAVLDCDFLFNPPISNIPEVAAENSIYEYIENDLGLTISYATKAITVEEVTPQLQQKLGLKDNMVVLVASQSFLSDATPFQLTLSFHNPSKFVFVDFARRQKIKP